MNLIQTILQYLHLETKEDFYLKYSDGTQSDASVYFDEDGILRWQDGSVCYDFNELICGKIEVVKINNLYCATLVNEDDPKEKVMFYTYGTNSYEAENNTWEYSQSTARILGKHYKQEEIRMICEVDRKDTRREQ